MSFHRRLFNLWPVSLFVCKLPRLNICHTLVQVNVKLNVFCGTPLLEILSLCGHSSHRNIYVIYLCNLYVTSWQYNYI